MERNCVHIRDNNGDDDNDDDDHQLTKSNHPHISCPFPVGIQYSIRRIW